MARNFNNVKGRKRGRKRDDKNKDNNKQSSSGKVFTLTNRNNKKDNKHVVKKLDKSTVKSIIKLPRFEQLKVVSSILRSKIVGNDRHSLRVLAGEHYEEILQLKHLAEQDSVNRWKKYSGIDYSKQGLQIRQGLLDNHQNLTKNNVVRILNQLEKVQNAYGRTSAKFAFFVGTDSFYKQLIEMPKKVVGMTWTSMQTYQNENTLVITRLLQGELDGKQYLFSNTIAAFEDLPKMNNSLSLLVNGQVGGLKPLARVDSAGFLPMSFLTDEMGYDIIEDIRLDENTINTLVNDHQHHNHISSKIKDLALPEEKASQQAHLHMATEMQDALKNIAHTVSKHISYQPKRSPLNAMNAKNVNVYFNKNATYKSVVEQMKEDAKKLYGYEPFERQFDFANELYGITNGELPKEIYNEIDKGRHQGHSASLPKLDTGLTIPFLEMHGFNKKGQPIIVPSIEHQKPAIPRNVVLNKNELRVYLEKQKIEEERQKDKIDRENFRKETLSFKLQSIAQYNDKNPGYLKIDENMTDEEIDKEFSKMQMFAKYDTKKNQRRNNNQQTKSFERTK